MAMKLLTTNTSSGAASSSFTSSIDSTYKLYIFKFIDINPATDSGVLSFQVNASSQSGYNETLTSSGFRAFHDEADSATGIGSVAADDQAQGTSFQPLVEIGIGTGNGADESCAGTLWLFNPSNTTYVKHWYSVMNNYVASNYSVNDYRAGYFNFTAALTNVQFKMIGAGGNFDGTIKMYGVA
jgi:hypothetical protein